MIAFIVALAMIALGAYCTATGRPMTHQGHAFTDTVSGETVRYWKDGHGRRWLATNRWGWFRVEAAER